jgi:uncharacterized membrane protein
LIACAVLVAVATLVILPAFFRGFPNGDDAYSYYRLAQEFDAAIREKGVIYPQWLGVANHGQGSPILLYCPPLPTLATAGFKLLVGDTSRSLALSCWSGMLLSALAMFALSRAFLAPWPSRVAAVFYALAPYHIVDLYQRSALAEYWAFAWLPLIFHAIHRIARGGGWRSVIYLAVSYGLLLSTHLVISFAITLLLPIYVLVVTRNPKRLIQTGAGLALGFGVGAISLASALFERGYIRADRALRFGYTHSFLFENIVSSLRLPSFIRAQKRTFFDDWLTSVALLVLLLFVLSMGAILISRRRRLLLKIGTVRAAIVVTVLGLLLTTRLSSPVWRTIPQLPYMQFPYRWLVVATFGSCLLAGVAASTVSREFKLKYLVVPALAGMLCLTGLIDKKAIKRASYDRQTLEVSLSIPESPEYRTRWSDRNAHGKEQLPPLAATEGDASVDVIDGEGAKQSYVVNAHTASTLRLRQLYFPGWVARVDGSPIAISPDQSGNMQLKVEPGEHRLDLSFEDTWPRTAGKVTSAASVLALLIMAYFTSAFHRKRSTHLAFGGERQVES